MKTKLRLFISLMLGGSSLLQAQNVGVGTSSPASKLDVEGGVSIGNNYSGAIAAPTNGAIIEGNVGIGTSSPLGKLHISHNSIPTVNLQSSSNVGTWLSIGNTDPLGKWFSIISTATSNGEGAGKLIFTRNVAANSTAGTIMAFDHANSNVGIGTFSPAASSVLDISSATKGLLIPRVVLTASNVASPVTSPAVSLFVYNTATAGVSPNNVTPGYYYWDGTTWQRFDTGNNTGDWKLDGNNNGVVRSIGTNDNFDLPIESNGTERMRITAAGNIGIGTSTPGFKLTTAYSTTGGSVPASGTTDPATGFRLTTGIVALDMGTITNGTSYIQNRNINNFATSYNLAINPIGGSVGIGTTNPAYKLHVTGDIYANGGWMRVSGNAGLYFESWGGGWNMTDATWIRSYNSKNVYCDQTIRADNGFQVDGNQVIDGDGGWHRSYGNAGWYNQTHGGGWWMQGSTWMESYNSKSVYTAGVMRGDQGLQVGGGGANFQVQASGYTSIWPNAAGSNVIVNNVSGEGSIYPSSSNWGYCGFNPNHWYKMYANDVYTWNSFIWIIYDTYDDLALLNGIQTDTLWDPVLNHHVMNIRTSTIPKIVTDYDEPNYNPNNPYISQKRMNGFLMGTARQLDREGKERDTRLAARTDLLANALGIDFQSIDTKAIKKNISEQGKSEGFGTKIEVSFSEDFQKQVLAGQEPMITITPRSPYETYYVSAVNEKGFTLVVKAEKDHFQFNWQATTTTLVSANNGDTENIGDVFHKKSLEIKGDYPVLDYEKEKAYKEKMLKDTKANLIPTHSEEPVGPVIFPVAKK